MNITETLLAAQSPDYNIRSEAEAIIKVVQELNLANFLLALSAELSSDQSPPESRRLAGIILKNSLDSKDSAKKKLLIQQWVNLDPSIKLKIKESLLITLGSSVADARHTSSQVIAMVASIEIPRGKWSDLIAKLLGNLQQGASSPLKQATLQALGYAFEKIHPPHLGMDRVNAVVTALVQVMNQAELSSEVHLAAVKVLYGVLKFAESHFANDDGRNIMDTICNAAESKELEIREAAFECLVAVVSTHYMHLKPYMETIFRLTTETMKGDEESVALKAVEFWSTICIHEEKKQEKYEGSDDANSTVNCRFIEKDLSSLVPVLLETLLKQDEDQERDDNAQNISMSRGTCLDLIARTVEDAIVPLVMQFVQDNIKAPNWRRRKAAISALGFILQGPSTEKLAPLVDLLLDTMKDPNSEVKDTTAWTLGRVFELRHPATENTIITNASLPRIMAVLIDSSKDVQTASEKVYEAIYFLARGYEDAILFHATAIVSVSSGLTPFLSGIIGALLSASELADKTHFRLRASIYETLSEIVRVSNLLEPNTYKPIGDLMHCIMKRLNVELDTETLPPGDKGYQGDHQVLLCGVLQVIIQKLNKSAVNCIITQAAHDLLFLFCRVLACSSSTARDKAMLAIGALAYSTGPDFEEHMPKFLRYYDEHQISPISVGVIRDIFYVLEDKILPFCDQIMDVLHKGLSELMLQAAIFSCFGDIALAIGGNFEKYLPDVMKKLERAADLVVVLEEDNVDYGNQLRQAIFKAYSGILQGIKDPKAGLKGAIRLFEFTEAVCKDRSRDKSVTIAAVAALDDLLGTFVSWTKEMIDHAMNY